MASREMIEIILKAEDQASQVVKQNEQNIKKFGDAAQQANQKAGQASQQMQQKMQMTNKHIDETTRNMRKIGRDGAESFRNLNKSQQDAAIKFNMLDKETQNLLQHMHTIGRNGLSGLGGAINDAKSKFQSLDGVTKTWSGSLDYSRSKLQLLGTNTDSLRGKIQVAGTAVTTYLGTKWDGIKSKVSSLGDHIKTKLTSALSNVRSKLDSLGSAFSGLGGIISSAIGMLGMSSITDLTIGLSMGRERMTALTQATTGSKEAADNLINGYKNLNYEFKDLEGKSTHAFMGLDEMTNHSLVGLDDLGQAMSNFKMATGATNDQLAYVAPTINDIGQRAILMGKSSDEALSLMQGAAQGLNGNFMSLERTFGVTKDKLEEMGWDGSAEDVEGYTDALQKYLDKGGEMDEMMDTSVGHLETLKKNFRIAGRHVGDMFTPYIDQAVVGLNNLNDTCPGLFEGLVEIAGGVSMFATLAPTISPMLMAFDNLAGKTRKVLGFLGLMEAEEGALTLATLRESAAQKVSAATKYLSGVATATYGAIVGVLTGEIGLVTAATQIWNAVMAANPIMLVVVALAALAVAIYEVGKYFGWWTDVNTMLEAIKANVMRLWDAFINNPNVQGVIQAIGDAWNWLLETCKPVIDWLSGIWVSIFPESAQGQWDVTRAIIDGIGLAFNLLTTPIRSVYEILVLLYPYMLQFYQGALVPLGNFLVTVFTPVWQLIQTILGQISPMVLSVSDAFTQFVNGQLPLPALVSNIFTNLWNIYTTILTSIGNAVLSWAGKLVSRGVSAASRFVSGIANRIASLPGRFATYLYSVVNRIVSAGASWVSNGVNAASRMVSGVITNVSQLPGKVYTEFMNIGSRIVSAGSDLVKKATDIGKNIVDGLLGAMGIHSPGIIQEKVVLEFVNMVGRVGSKIKSAYDTAKEMGNAIVEGFGNPTLETNVENLLPNPDEVKTQVGVKQELVHPVDTPKTGDTTIDTSMVDSSNAEVIGSFDNLALQTGTALQTMVDKDRIAYETIRNNDNTQLSAMTTNLQGKMSNMTNNVRTSMNNIVNKNKTGMNTVKNTTKTQLDNIVTKTKSANSKMIDSWKHMKDGIVSAANKIKTDSTTHFQKLESTIGGFYRKLQNPSGFGAGPGNGSVSTAKPLKRTGSNGFNKITNAIRKAQLPQYLSLGQIRSNPLIDNSNIGDYITTSGRNNRFSVSDLVRSGNIKIPIGLEDPKNKGAGSWTDGVGNHVKKIKDTSKNWSMKGPKIIGKYATSIGFKVKDFMNGTPKIDFNTFKRMAEDVFSQCHYEFYYDSNKYGNWMTAFQHGGMNCSDSSDALIAMAHACGLSASKVHGHWNQYGHFWANVAGRKMDTTGWMNQRNWTPSASHAGPAPKGFGFNDLINAIKDIFKDDDPNTSSGGLGENPGAVDTIEGNLTITHEFVNLPENISAEEVARLINDAPDDENWIKSLVRNIRFQKWDLKEKARLEAKNNRAKGV